MSIHNHQTFYTLFPSTEPTSSNLDVYYSESVRVPTSAHVAQIVGKQGAKIKLLRAKSNTFIQTPVPGEEPIFVITGRREDVAAIKMEILNAADHFSVIQMEREEKLTNSKRTPGSHQVHFEVPIFLVGLIVGKNGNNIRNVQRETNTYIETPKKDEPPIFKITGQRKKVSEAITKIQNHAKEKANLDFKQRIINDKEVELILLSQDLSVSNQYNCNCAGNCYSCQLNALLNNNNLVINGLN